MSKKTFHSFKEFWPFYMSEHVNSANRHMHFLGTLLVHVLAVLLIALSAWKWLWLLPVAGYSFAWLGHFGIEKNKPVAARYPIWSVIADFKMFYLMLLGKIK